MKNNRINPPPPAWRKPCERLSKHLDEQAENEGLFSNAETIRRLRRAYFADVDALEQSGVVKLPE